MRSKENVKEENIEEQKSKRGGTKRGHTRETNKKNEGKQRMDGLKRHFQRFDLVFRPELYVSHTGGRERGWSRVGWGGDADHSRAPPSRSQTLERRQARCFSHG